MYHYRFLTDNYDDYTVLPMSSRYFENTTCEYYPCHAIEKINCMFCFCPLYHFEKCLSKPNYTSTGVKDCSKCIAIHDERNYELIMQLLSRKGDEVFEQDCTL